MPYDMDVIRLIVHFLTGVSVPCRTSTIPRCSRKIRTLAIPMVSLRHSVRYAPPVLDAARAVVYDALKRSPFAGSPKKRPKKRNSSFKRSNNSDRDRAANAETHRARALGFRANTISTSISFHNPDRLR